MMAPPSPRSFVVDGFLALCVGERPADWHRALAAHAAAIAGRPSEGAKRRASSVAPAGAAADQALLWREITPELRDVFW